MFKKKTDKKEKVLKPKNVIVEELVEKEIVEEIKEVVKDLPTISSREVINQGGVSRVVYNMSDGTQQ